jgi:hypothetical protein
MRKKINQDNKAFVLQSYLYEATPVDTVGRGIGVGLSGLLLALPAVFFSPGTPI